ncbi:2B1E protein, partial [Pycnonotus jocosus]|nr:2B1E protein [Pycnonotus jocosus]
GGIPDLCPAYSGVFQYLVKFECYFINGTEKVRYIERYFYNRVQLVVFDSDVGHYVGFTLAGEKWAQDWNSNPKGMERTRTEVDWYCRPNYEVFAPFLTERRVHPSPSQFLPFHSQ